MKKQINLMAFIVMGLMVSLTASATLFDRGNGMIYDSDQNLTWLQDANHAQTSGYDSDGVMTWNEATTWASNLSFGGFDDWRLPSVTDNGNDGCNPAYSGTDCGYNVDTSGSELAYMWYSILGNTAYVDTNGISGQAGWGLSSTSADGVNIDNLQSESYWSGTEYAPDNNDAWRFHTLYGGQNNITKNDLFFAWAVHDGDIAGAQFTSIRIGDLDGFGFTSDVPNLVNANGAAADTNGNGILEQTEFLPDINGDGNVQVTFDLNDGNGVVGFDDFDNRSDVEFNGGFVTGSGFTDKGSAGSDFTDLSLSQSYDDAASVGNIYLSPGNDGPRAFPALPSINTPNQPGFEFHFDVVKGGINTSQTVFFNVVYGDYDVAPANIQITLNDGSNGAGTILTLPLVTQPISQDGLVQSAYLTLDFYDVFSDGGPVWNGFLKVDFVALQEPYTAFDFVELSTDPISPTVLNADAGLDVAVNEGQPVTLDGTASTGSDGIELSYSWVQIGGTAVTLIGADTSQPYFTTPYVALGGETLDFELTVTGDGLSNSDQVSISVVNINHVPVADAGIDQSIVEGSSVTLDGSDSFDMDSDLFSYTWTQISGTPAVITGADTASPSFIAPTSTVGGAPGIIATLVFKLSVDDGYPKDAPADGYTFADAEDTVTIEVTNVNNDPIADAGTDNTLNENSPIQLNGSASSDPDGDLLSYAWVQIGGPSVTLINDSTAMPSLTTPFVSLGGAVLTFELTVDDGFGGSATDQVLVYVQNANDPPLVSAARPTSECLWPPNHKLVEVGIIGVSDPDDNAVITIDSVTQDEPTNGLGDGDTAVDAVINSDGTVLLRAERSGKEDGRIYHIHFTASDLEGSASGVVEVCVPHNKKSTAVDGGELYDSTN